jgi:hypothetical protein
MSLKTTGSEFDVQAVETETGCEGSECLRLVKQLKKVHEDNLRRIDDQLGINGTEVKIGVT